MLRVAKTLELHHIKRENEHGSMNCIKDMRETYL